MSRTRGSSQAVPSETDRQVLQDYAGYCLLRWRKPYRRVLLAAGPSGSGTSRLLHALPQILGWVSSVPPSRLARCGGASKQLRGPWANICSGIDLEALAQLPLLKGFAPGGPGLESPEAAKRHKAYPATYRVTKHVYAAEELPPLAASDQFYERILLVAFPKKLPSQDLVPEGKLEAERDGILQWAMGGLRRVLGSEGFPSGQGPKETRQRWDALSGLIGRLKAGLLKVTGDPQDVIRKEDLYSTYKGGSVLNIQGVLSAGGRFRGDEGHAYPQQAYQRPADRGPEARPDLRGRPGPLLRRRPVARVVAAGGRGRIYALWSRMYGVVSGLSRLSGGRVRGRPASGATRIGASYV